MFTAQELSKLIDDGIWFELNPTSPIYSDDMGPVSGTLRKSQEWEIRCYSGNAGNTMLWLQRAYAFLVNQQNGGGPRVSHITVYRGGNSVMIGYGEETEVPPRWTTGDTLTAAMGSLV